MGGMGFVNIYLFSSSSLINPLELHTFCNYFFPDAVLSMYIAKLFLIDIHIFNIPH